MPEQQLVPERAQVLVLEPERQPVLAAEAVQRRQVREPARELVQQRALLQEPGLRALGQQPERRQRRR